MYPEQVWAVDTGSGNEFRMMVYLAYYKASKGDYVFKQITNKPVTLEYAKFLARKTRQSRSFFLDMALSNENVFDELPNEGHHTQIILQEWRHQ